MKNAEYWRKEAEEIEKALHKKSEEYYKKAEKQFRIAEKKIADDIEKWYARLADNNDISLAEARKFLTADELEEFKWTVEEYIKHGKENGVSKDWQKELENASAKYHIRRLEAVQTQIQQHIELLYTGLASGLTEHLAEVYEEAYYRNVFSIQRGFEVGSTMAKLDNRRIQKALEHCWAMDGRTFDTRIWQNKATLVNELNTILTQSIIRGENPGDYITALAKKMNTSRKNASRLIYTESAFIASQADKDCYKDLGIEEFEFVATLDSHTSKICRDMDGQHFKMSEYQIGVNAPPLHPHCRSTTVPYFHDEFTAGEQRAARDENGDTYYVPGDMTYEEWREKYVNNDSFKSSNQTEEGNNNYSDVTKEWYSNATQNIHKVADLQEYTTDGITYKVDGKHVTLDYREREKQVAELIASELGGEIYMVPRVAYPQGISTPDYLINGEKYDLKEPQGKGKNVLYGMLKKKKKQSNNFIFDISACPLEESEILRQIDGIYQSKHMAFVEKVILLKNDKIIRIFERK